MNYRVERNVMVAMRDGAALATDIWIPDGPPAPTLLVRVPYGKSSMFVLSLAVNPDIFALLDAGYVVVRQDCRGTSASEGEFIPMASEHEDGIDTIEWVRQQPWSDGVVGTYGASYLGFTQLALASQKPEGLKAIAPAVTDPDMYRAWHSGGALIWHNALFWATFMAAAGIQRGMAHGEGDLARLVALANDSADLQASPIAKLEDAMPGDQYQLADVLSWWTDWLRHPERGPFWDELSSSSDQGEVTVPALHIGGWFDLFAGNTAREFARMRAHAASDAVRKGHLLIIGPWDHQEYTGLYKDRQFGPAAHIATIGLTETYLRFYDRWLRGKTAAQPAQAPVRIFVMGLDEWREEQDWPLPDTEYVDFFLDGGGKANSAAGDGVLRSVVPIADVSDCYVYDPARPVPSLGGRVWQPSALNSVGPVDQRQIEARNDVLCYTSPVLEEPIEVTGHITLVLHVASSALDTDFTGTLVDVHPDGRAIYLTDGILRARYRNSLTAPELLEPEVEYELTLDLSVTSNVFLSGHRIRLDLSSSNYPRYDRNTNTGGDINTESLEDSVVATNRVLHGPAHPSRLVLPVIKR